ncbi:hypothetical protein MRB53_002198 [Persea americana]|uniref:Uncharacterized protein n=1 Tax=Persea americana TaxID=3435 RepID=A0ACC2MUS3_PERAE|nr:hypothetical protein MRB53_002198 [Persea americana]
MASGQTMLTGNREQAKFDDGGDVKEGTGLLLSAADEDDAGGPRGCCSLLTGHAMMLVHKSSPNPGSNPGIWEFWELHDRCPDLSPKSVTESGETPPASQDFKKSISNNYLAIKHLHQ